jgi:hypothetical protein
MEISSLIQSDFTTLSNIEPIKNNSAVKENNTNNITDTINKNAYDYVDLGIDISDFVKVDNIQEQTNKELVGYLTGIIDNESIEGKKNLKAYDIAPKAIYFVDFQKILQEDLKYLTSAKQLEMRDQSIDVPLELSKNLITKKSSKALSLPQAIAAGNPNVGVTSYHDTFKEITEKESKVLNIEKFKNLYSFSEEFTQTQGFEDLYQQYKKQSLDKAAEPIKSYEDIETEAYIISNVVSNNLSKSEVIKYYTGISTDLREKLAEGFPVADWIRASVHQDMRNTIDLYDKMTFDLKDMWGFGDLDIHI